MFTFLVFQWFDVSQYCQIIQKLEFSYNMKISLNCLVVGKISNFPQLAKNQ